MEFKLSRGIPLHRPPYVGERVEVNPEFVTMLEKEGRKAFAEVWDRALEHIAKVILVREHIISLSDGTLLKSFSIKGTINGAVGLACSVREDGSAIGTRGLPYVPMLLLVEEAQPIQTLNPNYCSCNGPAKQSYTFNGEPFMICTTCGKEKS